MSASLALQYAIIALAVSVSVVVVVRKQFPGAVRKARVALALVLLREGRPEWLHAVGRRIAPPGNKGATACGGCNGCDTP